VWHNEWQVGDTLIWDNRALIHRRDAFDNNQRRMMHRVQIRGETTS
jgi:alpha-ketoglutarate-dependent taurine dioxygenase